MTAADDVAAQLAAAGNVPLIADNGTGPAASLPQTLRQAVQRLLFEATLWIQEYPPGAKAVDAADTVLGHAARAAGFGRAALAVAQSNAAALQRIEAKVDALAVQQQSGK